MLILQQDKGIMLSYAKYMLGEGSKKNMLTGLRSMLGTYVTYLVWVFIFLTIPVICSSYFDKPKLQVFVGDSGFIHKMYNWKYFESRALTGFLCSTFLALAATLPALLVLLARNQFFFESKTEDEKTVDYYFKTHIFQYIGILFNCYNIVAHGLHIKSYIDQKYLLTITSAGILAALAFADACWMCV